MKTLPTGKCRTENSQYFLFIYRYFGGFPGGPVVKTSPYNAGSTGLIPAWEAKTLNALCLVTKKPEHKTKSLKKMMFCKSNHYAVYSKIIWFFTSLKSQ